jgi:PPP family 3-phenylpropionic acid transporter
MAHLVAGDWGRYGRIRLWGSIGFMATVFIAGAWFEHFGMGHFPGWTLLTLAAVLGGTLWLPDSREKRTDAHDAGSPVGPVLRQAPVRWFFATLFFHVTAHFSIYAYFSLYLDSKGYGKATIGALWAVSVVVEIAWFFLQGRLMRLARMSRWLMVCSLATVLRMALVGVAADWILALVLAQMLHALTFAAHHTACIAVVTHHFPGRLRARGQALFTVIGYGLGGMLGVLVGGALITGLGYEALYGAASLLAALAAACAWRMQRLERAQHDEHQPVV